MWNVCHLEMVAQMSTGTSCAPRFDNTSSAQSKRPLGEHAPGQRQPQFYRHAQYQGRRVCEICGLSWAGNRPSARVHAVATVWPVGLACAQWFGTRSVRVKDLVRSHPGSVCQLAANCAGGQRTVRGTVVQAGRQPGPHALGCLLQHRCRPNVCCMGVKYSPTVCQASTVPKVGVN